MCTNSLSLIALKTQPLLRYIYPSHLISHLTLRLCVTPTIPFTSLFVSFIDRLSCGYCVCSVCSRMPLFRLCVVCRRKSKASMNAVCVVCCVVLCCAVLWLCYGYAVLCCVLWCAVLCVVLPHAILMCAVLLCCRSAAAVLCCAVLCCRCG